MTDFVRGLILLAVLGCSHAHDPESFTLAIHGGAGTISREDIGAVREAEIRRMLEQTLLFGEARLAAGDAAVDVVMAVVQRLEDFAHFNAGHGAVFNAKGGHELDAAIMDGRGPRAGAVAAVTSLANPITLARKVMDESPHVLLIGAGAERFADQFPELKRVDPAYFHTDFRYQQFQQAKARTQARVEAPPTAYYGTVGAVAQDRTGHLAAATSTGGMTFKQFGRVGDVPVIGAGTYANDRSCAVSATGHGEYFIRAVAAHSVCQHLSLRDVSLDAAAKAVIWDELHAVGGSGGLIAVSAKGEVTAEFNSAGMYHALRAADGSKTIRIYRDE